MALIYNVRKIAAAVLDTTGQEVQLTGGTMAGPLSLGGQNLINAKVVNMTVSALSTSTTLAPTVGAAYTWDLSTLTANNMTSGAFTNTNQNFVAPVAGIWSFSTTASVTAASTATVTFTLTKNNLAAAPISKSTHNTANATGPAYGTNSVMFYMNGTTDYVSVRVDNHVTSAGNITYPSASATTFLTATLVQRTA
jgi:hypothetical protein